MREIIFACSNRSEYGLVRPLLLEVILHPKTYSSIKTVLLLYSKAVVDCQNNANRDLYNANVEVRVDVKTVKKNAECMQEHFGRLVNYFCNSRGILADMLVLAGDRYESFAVAQAAFYRHIPFAQLFAGDISQGGHFDDHARHAISHLASILFPVNRVAHANLIKMRQKKSRVFFLGSPVVDEIAGLMKDQTKQDNYDVILSFNPMTLQDSEPVAGHVKATLEALNSIQSTVRLKCLVTEPNDEPGGEEIKQVYNDYKSKDWIQIVPSVGSPDYLYAIKGAKIVIGNSSSQLLEVPLLGKRSLLIGKRQKGRFKPKSVASLMVNVRPDKIKKAILKLISLPEPSPCLDYGEAGVSKKIMEVILRLSSVPNSLLVQKHENLPQINF